MNERVEKRQKHVFEDQLATRVRKVSLSRERFGSTVSTWFRFHERETETKRKGENRRGYERGVRVPSKLRSRERQNSSAFRRGVALAAARLCKSIRIELCTSSPIIVISLAIVFTNTFKCIRLL